MRTEQSKQTKRWIGVIWFIIGLALVLSDNAGGWIFFILGFSYLAGTTHRGEVLSKKNPKLARWLIYAITAFSILLVIMILFLKYL